MSTIDAHPYSVNQSTRHSTIEFHTRIAILYIGISTWPFPGRLMCLI